MTSLRWQPRDHRLVSARKTASGLSPPYSCYSTAARGNPRGSASLPPPKVIYKERTRKLCNLSPTPRASRP